MLKKTISLMIVFIMIISLVKPLYAFGESKDYIGHWAEDTIQSWIAKGYVTGYPDGSFKPEGLVTRAEFVKMANNLLGYIEIGEINFTDVSSVDWYYREVQKAFKEGYISGNTETEFGPSDNLTREQAAIIVSKIMKLEGDPSGAEIFVDSNNISSWAKDYVGSAAKAQLVMGYDVDNTFRPQNPITRAEAIVILSRIIIEEVDIPESTTPLGGGDVISPGGGGSGGTGGTGGPGGVETPTESVVLSWTDPSGNKEVGEEKNIEINIKLKDSVNSIDNVAVVMSWEEKVGSNWKVINKDNITLTNSNGEILKNENGMYRLFEGLKLESNSVINTKVTFNKVGEYKLTIYAIKE